MLSPFVEQPSDINSEDMEGAEDNYRRHRIGIDRLQGRLFLQKLIHIQILQRKRRRHKLHLANRLQRLLKPGRFH